MNIAVCVHGVADPEVPVSLDGRGGIDLRSAVRLLDPADAAALEMAVRLADEEASEVVAFLAGTPDDDNVLRSALSHGAATAVRVDCEPPSGRLAGEYLAGAIDGRKPDLVFCGSESSDFRTGATPATLARRLGLPVVSHVVSLDLLEGRRLRAERRREGGYREVVEVVLPAVVAIDRGAATPRFPTTQARLRARRAMIEVLRPAGIDAPARTIEELGYVAPPPSRHGVAWPDPQMDARARLKFLLQGGATRSGGDGRASGSPEEVAAEIARFLRERNLIPFA